MEVFLIPAGDEPYHLYCEVAGEMRPATVEGRGGWRRRAADRFTSIVARVDAARHGAARRRAQRAPRSLAHRVRDRIVCWLAEKIAEQRLLWHLRGQDEVVAWFPDDIVRAEALAYIRRSLDEDARRHRKWAVANLVAGAFSLLLVPIPGPNLLGYYFTFRIVGHYLSHRGARHGLDAVAWRLEPTAALTELREAIRLAPEQRKERVADIASRLRLEHQPAVLERIAVPAR